MDRGLKIILIIALIIFGLSSLANAYVNWNRFTLEHESYISTLLDSYNRDMNSCLAEIDKQEDKTNIEARKKEQCVNPINESRTAELLKQWGYEDELFKIE